MTTKNHANGQDNGLSKLKRADSEAQILTRIAGGAVFGATLGSLGGPPVAILGGIAGAAVLGSAPYFIVGVAEKSKH